MKRESPSAMDYSMEQVILEFKGKQINATLQPPMWYVTIGGTALTKLPASASDTEASVRAQVLAWVETHPDMLDRDQIVLGGG
jgi:hypothetical protein